MKKENEVKPTIEEKKEIAFKQFQKIHPNAYDTKYKGLVAAYYKIKWMNQEEEKFNNNNNVISQNDLGEKFSCGLTTTKKYISILKTLNLITVTPLTGNKKGKMKYEINEEQDVDFHYNISFLKTMKERKNWINNFFGEALSLYNAAKETKATKENVPTVQVGQSDYKELADKIYKEIKPTFGAREIYFEVGYRNGKKWRYKILVTKKVIIEFLNNNVEYVAFDYNNITGKEATSLLYYYPINNIKASHGEAITNNNDNLVLEEVQIKEKIEKVKYAAAEINKEDKVTYTIPSLGEFPNNGDNLEDLFTSSDVSEQEHNNVIINIEDTQEVNTTSSEEDSKNKEEMIEQQEVKDVYMELLFDEELTSEEVIVKIQLKENQHIKCIDNRVLNGYVRAIKGDRNLIYYINEANKSITALNNSNQGDENYSSLLNTANLFINIFNNDFKLYKILIPTIK